LKLFDFSCYLSDNEADSSDLSDENTVDSEEDNRSSSSLMDRLLDDVAANCSGIFDYSEDSKSDEHNKISIDDNDDGDRDDKDEDELIRRYRKPRKRRLLFTPDDSDEDKENEEKDALKSIKNVHNLEADDRNDIETGIVSNQKKTNSADDVNALINESDEFNVNNQDSFLFSDEDDGRERNVIEPIDEANDENEQVEGMEEADSSDDELKIFRKLERTQKAKKKLILKSEYIDEEASLSGDDVGSDENDDEDQLDVYEAEEGDNDELPDDETIREQLHKQWLKQQQDEEDRKLLYWKDQLLIDGDLTEETDRTFRFKLRVTENENANEKMDDVAVDAENEVDDDEICKRRREISKWKIETKKVELHGESTLLKKTNPLLKAASKIIDKGNLNGNSQSDEQADTLVCKNSLLYHRKSLSQVLNQTKITLYTKCAETSSAHANGHIKRPLPSQEARRCVDVCLAPHYNDFLSFCLVD
uniref:Claspin n=1 Tax=Onchocerca flexuosa TaxID=387005 RepID=A0A183H7H9_9BILA